MKNNRLLIRKWIPAVVIATAVAASSAYAGGFFGGGHHRGGIIKPIERMVEHVDLSERQEIQVEAILENARQGSKDRFETRHRFFKQMIEETLTKKVGQDTRGRPSKVA